MHCLKRNQVPFWYAPYLGKTDILDDYGNVTGEYTIGYGDPVPMKGNISAARGEILNRQFGDSEAYDRVIVLDDPKTPIDEYSILWVDKKPIGTHDYVVKKVARSLNSVSIAITKVNVR